MFKQLAYRVGIASVALALPMVAHAGAIFLTGHDPDFHASLGGNLTGARDINTTAINFITNPAFNTFAAGGVTLNSCSWNPAFHLRPAIPSGKTAS